MRSLRFVGCLLSVCLPSLLFAQAEPEDIAPPYQVVSTCYWFDMNPSTKQVHYAPTLNLDLSALDEGLHSLHYQVVADNGSTSPVMTTFFSKLPPDEEFKDYTIQSVRYWFDLDQSTQRVSYSNTVNLDLSALDEGLHSLHYQVVADNGSTSPVMTTFFNQLKGNPDVEGWQIARVDYGFDSMDNLLSASFNREGMALDAARTEEGDHELYFQLVSDDGTSSPMYTRMFYRSLYDLLIREPRHYNDSILTVEPLLTQKPDLKIDYVVSDVTRRGRLTTENTEVLSFGKFCEAAYWGCTNDNSKYTVADGNHYHPTSLVANGRMRADSVMVQLDVYKDRWHFLSLPFNTKVSDIAVKADNYWVVRTYDGQSRAQGMMDATWLNLNREDIMKAGKGYILQTTNDKETKNVSFLFKSINDTRKNDMFTAEDVRVPLDTYEAAFAHNRSWNLTGNPYPCFFDTRHIDTDGIITVWNGNGYSAYSLDDDQYVLMPFEAFFIQKPLDAEDITFRATGRQHDYVAMSEPSRVGARRMTANSDRQLYNFSLTNGEEIDHCRIVINALASPAYEIGKDAPKFLAENPRTAQLFSTEGGVRYAIDERPLGNGCIVLSILIPEEGDYTLSLENAPAEALLVDALTGTRTLLSEDSYTFHAEAGTHEARFTVLLTDATDIPQVDVTDDGEVTVIGHEVTFHFILPKRVRIVGANGMTYFDETTANGRVLLESGVYVVDIQGKKTKMVISSR